MACFVHFLYSRDPYFTGARESPSVNLPRLKKTNQKETKNYIHSYDSKPAYFLHL